MSKLPHAAFKFPYLPTLPPALIFSKNPGLRNQKKNSRGGTVVSTPNPGISHSLRFACFLNTLFHG